MIEKQIKNKLKNSTCLVTGGAGFIGSSMCKKLLEYGAKVICVDNLSSGSIENIKKLRENENFIFFCADVNTLDEIIDFFNWYKIDYVFHYAAMVGVKRTLENPLEVLKDIDGFKNILELSRLYKIKKIIFSSSSEVYGEPVEFPQKEDSTPLNAKLPYALVKSIGEVYFKSYYKKYKLPIVNLRFFNVYGPKQNSTPYGFVTTIFLNQAINNKSLTIFGNGYQTRDFIFIDDNINATLQALLSSKCNGETINIGNSKAITILELAKKIIKISGKKLNIKFCSSRKIGDVKGRRPDISKMKKIYTPIYNIDKGLKITYKWYNDKIH